MTWPRWMSSRLTPRRSRPTLSPARPSSSSLRNISTPVQTVLSILSFMPDDLDGLADLDHAALDASGGHGAAARDGEDVLDRHQERLVHRPLRHGDVVVHRRHQGEDVLGRRGVAVQGVKGRALDDRDVVARELVGGEQLADLELDELEQLLVVDHVGLVEEHDDRRHADLAGEQDVLAGLRHRAVRGGDHEDGAVHLGGARDHVLDVVGVTRAVHVGVVPVLGLVLHVRGGDGDAALALLGGLVDGVERDGLACRRRASRRGPS